MIGLILAISIAPFQTGAYGLPQLCKTLTSLTGIKHDVDGSLVDYPVFVSVKSKDANRIESLVAKAFHSEWKQVGAGKILKIVKPIRDEGFLEFERQFRLTSKGDVQLLNLPMHDLYMMAPGELVRYGPTKTATIRLAPQIVQKKDGLASSIVRVRRMASGVFEFAVGGTDFTFSGLPDDVKNLLADDLKKEPLKPEQIADLGKHISNPELLQTDWQDINVKDPIGALQERLLTPLAEAIKPDLVIALPDFSILAMIGPSGNSKDVGSILGKLTCVVTWKSVEGAVVGCLTDCEVNAPAQARRSVMSRMIGAVGKGGVANVSALSEYVSSQRPAASDTWTDAILLVMAGVVIDQEYIGDYPYNIRLYTQLDQDDWKLLRFGKPFPAAAFNLKVRKHLMDLLLQSRSRLEDRNIPDPAVWDTLDLSRVSVTATVDEKPILIAYTMVGGEVGSAKEAGMNYDSRRKTLGHEPTYQPAVRRKLKLVISSTGSGQSVETGYSEVAPDKSAPVVWQKLAQNFRDEFSSGLKDMRKQDVTGVGKPPP